MNTHKKEGAMTGISEVLKEEVILAIKHDSNNPQMETMGFSIVKKDNYTPSAAIVVVDTITVDGEEYLILHDIG